MLEPEQEYMLAKRWVEDGDTDAAHQMVTSHLRLAAKIAMGYRGYGLPQAEVISEANVGLMQAVKRFDPEKGFRLATYAMWWIRASIQEYILRSWSLVKLGTTRRRRSCSSTCARPRPASARWRRAICAPRTSRDRQRPRRDRGRGDLDEPAAVGGRRLAQRHDRQRGRRRHAMAGLAGGRDANQAEDYAEQDEWTPSASP
jgi:RNA polymerase sigma-32 factor